MANPEEITRNYHNISDAEMTQFSNTIHGIFITEKPQFIVFDPDFADPFAANWLTKIENAEELPSDETVEDELKQLSNTVEEKMELCRHKFQSAKFFIEKAFPDNLAVRNEFGYDDYEGARQSQVKMIFFMGNFHRVAEKYKVKLIAKNYTQPMIDEIDALRDQLHGANNVQEAFKAGRPVLTQDRIIILNTCWDETLKVCTAGKIIFHDNKAKHDQFLLPGDQPSPPPLVTFLSAVTNQNVLQGFNTGIRGFAGDEASILWGDSNTNDLTLDGTTQNTPHNYVTPGNYTIEQKGDHPERIIELLITHAMLTSALPANNLTALEILNLEYNPLINFVMPTGLTSINYVSFLSCALNAASINSILQVINGYNTSGGTLLLHGGTNAAPTGQGIVAKNQLESRGWAVATN